jgi:hypothetical protein
MSAQPIEIRMAHLEGAYEQLDKRIALLTSTMDSRFAQVDSRFAQVDGRLAQIDGRIDGLGKKIDAVQWRTASLIVVTWISTLMTILFKH